MRKRELSSKSLIRVEGSLFTTMDTKTICEVVAWIKAHEDLLNFFQDDINTGGSPSEVFFEFCANRTSVYPYPKKCQEKVPNGCRFHSQTIFSEKVVGYLEAEKKRIDAAYKEQEAALLKTMKENLKDKELAVSDGEETSSIPAVQSQYNSSVATPKPLRASALLKRRSLRSG